MCIRDRMISVSQNSIEKIRNDLFDKLQGLPVRFYDNESNGEIMSLSLIHISMCIRDSTCTMPGSSVVSPGAV